VKFQLVNLLSDPIFLESLKIAAASKLSPVHSFLYGASGHLGLLHASHLSADPLFRVFKYTVFSSCASMPDSPRFIGDFPLLYHRISELNILGRSSPQCLITPSFIWSTPPLRYEVVVDPILSDYITKHESILQGVLSAHPDTIDISILLQSILLCHSSSPTLYPMTQIIVLTVALARIPNNINPNLWVVQSSLATILRHLLEHWVLRVPFSFTG